MPGNIAGLCRLCLRNIGRYGTPIAIFDPMDLQQELVNKITSCLPLCLNISDNKPKYICKACHYKLEHFYKFRTDCLLSETYLNEQLNTEYETCDVEIEFCDNGDAYLCSNTVGTLELFNALTQVCQSKGKNSSTEVKELSTEVEYADNISITHQCPPIIVEDASHQDHDISSIPYNSDDSVSSLSICEENLEDCRMLVDESQTESYHYSDKQLTDSTQKLAVDQLAVTVTQLGTENPKSPQLLNKKQCKESSLQENKKSEFYCTFCNHLFDSSVEIQAHLVDKHNLEKNRQNVSMFAEIQNSEPFNQNNEVTLDIASNFVHKDEVESFSCECGAIFSNIEDLKIHITEKHLNLNHSDIFTCETCGKKLKSEAERVDHISSHFEDLKCTHCTFKSKIKHILDTHERHCYKQNWPFQCLQCKEKFLVPEDLTVHKDVHKIQEINCPIVDSKKMENIASYNNALHINGEKEKKQTSLVNKKLKAQSVVNDIFVCDFCQQNFVLKSSIEYHMLKHLAERQILSVSIAQLTTENY